MLVAVAALAVATIVVVVVARSDGDASDRADEVAARGREVMPFDLERTTHVFAPTASGGIQTVVADEPGDTEQVAVIRSHLREEIERFTVGDFGDPAAIHDDDMPGLAVLEAEHESLDASYRDVADGGEITYRSTDLVVVAALHEWFEAQLSDHGSHAQAG